jgi:hypothetical protein
MAGVTTASEIGVSIEVGCEAKLKTVLPVHACGRERLCSVGFDQSS